MSAADTLRLIAGRSAAAQRLAIGALRALDTGSPMAGSRASRAAAAALEDERARWTDAERAQIAELVGVRRSHDLRIPVSPDELAQVQADAAAAGLTMAAYVRRRLGL